MKAIALLVTFLGAFFLTTFLTDMICNKIGYYDEPTEYYE